MTLKIQNWANNIQREAKKVGIINSAQLHRALNEAGLKVCLMVVWRWWVGEVRPKTADQYKALNQVLRVKDSQLLFLYAF